MARSTRATTKEHIETAAELYPLSLGPLLGRFALRLNVSPPVIAAMIGSHEETVLRWLRNQSSIRPEWMPRVAKLIAFFAWMVDAQWEPLHGTIEERKKQLAAAGKVFADLSGVKQTRTVKR
jgi:hypothetical protein